MGISCVDAHLHTITHARARTHSHTHSRFSAKSSGLSYAVDSSGGRTGDRATRHRRDRRCTPRCSAAVPTQPCTTTAIRHTTCKIKADRAVPRLARNSWRSSAVHGIVGGPVPYTDSTVVPPGSARACFSESHRQPLRPSQRGRRSWRMEGHRHRDHCDHRGTPVTSKQHTYPRRLRFALHRSAADGECATAGVGHGVPLCGRRYRRCDCGC